MNYILVERLCLPLVWVTQKLRYYFLSHTVHYLAQMDPIRYLFEKALSERLALWQVLLCEFDLIYKALKAIKGQAIADHLSGLLLEAYEPVKPIFQMRRFLL